MLSEVLAQSANANALSTFTAHSKAPIQNTAAKLAVQNSKVAHVGSATQENVVNNNPVLAGLLGNQSLILGIGIGMLILIIWLAVTHRGL